MTLGPDLDAARARVVAHGLAAKAFAQLTPVVTELDLSLAEATDALAREVAG